MRRWRDWRPVRQGPSGGSSRGRGGKALYPAPPYAAAPIAVAPPAAPVTEPILAPTLPAFPAEGLPTEGDTRGSWRVAEWPTFALAGLVVVVVFAMQAYRLTRAPDVFVDEITYFYVGKSIAQGDAMRQYWFAPDRAFFWQPPFYFLLEAGVAKLFNPLLTGPFAAIFLMRYLNVAIAALTSGLLFLLGVRLRDRVTGIGIVLLFALDPFILRSARRNLLEVTVMLLVVCGILVLRRFPHGLNHRGAVWLGLIFGLVLLTKEVAFYTLAVSPVFLLLGQPREYRRLLPGLVGSAGISLALYALYPLWAFWSGNGADFLYFKLFQLQRFQGLIQISGWNRAPVAASGSRPPTFIEALGVNLPLYGTSYVLILLGGALGLYLLSRSRYDHNARLLGAWGLVNDFFFAYTIARGQLNDQFFYLLLIPTAAIVGYSAPLLARLLFVGRDWRGFLRVPAATLALLTLPGLFSYNSLLYYSNYVVGVDDGYRQVHDYLVAHVPTGSPLLIGSDTGIHVFPEYHTYLERTPESVRALHIHYFVLSSKDAWGRYNGVTPEFYDWVVANSIELFAIEETTFWRLGVYYMAYPDEYRTTTNASPGEAPPPAFTPVQLAARPIPPVADTNDRRYFASTGHTVSGPFRRYWEARGGLLLFGYPLTEPFEEDGRLVQYFERARMDWYPEYMGTEREVQLAPLGQQLTQARLSQTAFRPITSGDVAPDRRFFAANGHSLGGPFQRYWEQFGGQEIFGLPISEELTEISPTDGLPYTVQYFERARFEYHPEYAGTRNEILLGLLGRQALIYRGWQP